MSRATRQRVDGRAGGLRPGVPDALGGAGLEDDDRHAVRDRVVQLARDPQALLAARARRARVARPLELARDGAQLPRPQRAVAHGRPATQASRATAPTRATAEGDVPREQTSRPASALRSGERSAPVKAGRISSTIGVTRTEGRHERSARRRRAWIAAASGTRRRTRAARGDAPPRRSRRRPLEPRGGQGLDRHRREHARGEHASAPPRVAAGGRSRGGGLGAPARAPGRPLGRARAPGPARGRRGEARRSRRGCRRAPRGRRPRSAPAPRAPLRLLAATRCAPAAWSEISPTRCARASWTPIASRARSSATAAALLLVGGAEGLPAAGQLGDGGAAPAQQVADAAGVPSSSAKKTRSSRRVVHARRELVGRGHGRDRQPRRPTRLSPARPRSGPAAGTGDHRRQRGRSRATSSPPAAASTVSAPR